MHGLSSLRQKHEIEIGAGVRRWKGRECLEHVSGLDSDCQRDFHDYRLIETDGTGE